MLLGGCSNSSQASDSLIGTWGATAPEKPQLVFETEDEFHGTDGCNQIGGTVTTSSDGIEFGPMRSTRMYCEGVDTWLLDASRATIDGNIMTLFDASGTEIGTLQRVE